MIAEAFRELCENHPEMSPKLAGDKSLELAVPGESGLIVFVDEQDDGSLAALLMKNVNLTEGDDPHWDVEDELPVEPGGSVSEAVEDLLEMLAAREAVSRSQHDDMLEGWLAPGEQPGSFYWGEDKLQRARSMVDRLRQANRHAS